MPDRVRRLLLVGVVLTALSLLGLAVTVGRPAGISAGWGRLFLVVYGVGAVCLIGAGIWWLVRFTRQRSNGR